MKARGGLGKGSVWDEEVKREDKRADERGGDKGLQIKGSKKIGCTHLKCRHEGEMDAVINMHGT